MIERCLIIREPWITEILSGRKTWEMRSKPTLIRGEIGLVAQGTGMIAGRAVLADSLPPLTASNYMSHTDRHAIPSAMLDEVLANGWVYPWVLEDVQRFERPIPYAHRSGAVTFVILEGGIEVPTPWGLRDQEGRTAIGQVARDQSQSHCGAADPRLIFHFRPDKAHARGMPLADGSFTVLAGSTAMRNGSPRVKRDRGYREQLLRAGELVEHSDPELLVFERDHRFSSASKAAGIIKDGNASGPQLWVDPITGRSLRDYLR